MWFNLAAHWKFQICIHVLKFREPNWSDFLNISIRNSLFSKWSSKWCDHSLFSLINSVLHCEPPSDILSLYTCLKFEMRQACNSLRVLQYRGPLGFLQDKFDLSFIWKSLKRIFIINWEGPRWKLPVPYMGEESESQLLLHKLSHPKIH